MDYLIYSAPAAGALALIFAFIKASSVSKESAGDETMQRIASTRERAYDSSAAAACPHRCMRYSTAQPPFYAAQGARPALPGRAAGPAATVEICSHFEKFDRRYRKTECRISAWQPTTPPRQTNPVF